MLTYNVIYNTALSWLKSNCANITSFNNIPDVFKKGHSWEIHRKIFDYGPHIGMNYDGPFTAITYCSVVSSPVAAYTAQNLTENFNSYLNSVGFTSDHIAQNMDNNGLLSMFNCICSYCNSNIVLVTSSFSSNTYIIYTPNNKYTSSNNLFSNQIYKFPINQLLDTLIIEIKNSIKSSPVKYGFTYGGYHHL